MIFTRKHRRSEVSSVNFLLNGDLILPQTSVKYLGVLVDQDFTWSLQVGHVRTKSLAALAAIRRVSMYMPTRVLLALYNAFVLPHFNYCCVVWHFCSKSMSINLQQVQNYAMQIILKKPPRTSSEVCLHLLGWLNLYQRRCINLLWQVHKCYVQF